MTEGSTKEIESYAGPLTDICTWTATAHCLSGVRRFCLLHNSQIVTIEGGQDAL